MFKQSRFFLQFYHSKGLFRIRKQQKSDFQKFFEISLEDKPTKSKLLSYYILLKKKPSYKTFKVFLLFNVAIFFGLLIIPGSKIVFQYKLKLTLNDIYTDIIFSLAILHNESTYLDYVGRNILDSLLLLSNEGIYEVDYTVKNIDRINRLIEEMPISENTLRGTLVNMGALIKFIIKEKTDTLIEPDFQESLMEFMNLAVAKSKFEDSANFLKDKSNLLNEEKFVRLIDSYKEIVNLWKILLGYQKDAVKKAQIYKYLVVLLEKESNQKIIKGLKFFKIARSLNLRRSSPT